MRCKKCRKKAVINLTRHHTAFCRDCFDGFVLDQVRRAIRSHHMLQRQDRVAVAVSGGKDSLALWDILLRLGWPVVGVHIHLGIGDYSHQSRAMTEQFARQHQGELVVQALEETYGGGVPELAQQSHRPACSACGVMKRYNFNRLALDAGCTVLATGHNLDDEAARLLGNVLRWQQDYLDKQSPVLPATQVGFVKKIKPLIRLTEREMAAYCVLRKIDYIVEECPMSRDAKQLVYKDVLNRLEAASPGTKQNFYMEFLKRNRPAAETKDLQLKPCEHCGQPTTARVCSHCKLTRMLAAAPGGQAESPVS